MPSLTRPTRAHARGGIAFLLVLSFLGPVPRALEAQAPTRNLTGTVVDAATGRPLASATVTGGTSSTVTLADGRFLLPLRSDVQSVHVERMGYAGRDVPLAGWSDVLRLEPAPYLLERIAVEVRRGEALAAGTALAMSSVERPTLDAAGGTSLAEALGGLEGVDDARVGSWGSRPVIRGLAGERIAVLIDGNRVNRACTFGMDQGLASVDPAQVERVEIVSGPGSALVGSGSIGGVINVVTRSDAATSGTSGEIRAGASSAVPGGTLGGSVRAGSPRVRVGLNVDASSYGDYRMPDATMEGSSFRHVTGDGKIDLRPSAAHRVSLKAQYYAGRDIGWPMMKGAEIPSETRTSYSVDYGWQLARGILDGMTVRAFRQKLDHHMTVDAIMNGPTGPMTTRADAVSYSTTSGGRAQLRLTPASMVSVDVGAELTRWFAEGTRWTESGSAAMPPNSQTFRTWPAVDIRDAGAFFQGETRIGTRVTASMGGRLDRVAREAEGEPESTETVATGNMGLRLALPAGVGLRTSVGLGYRSPDPMELYGLALKPDGFVYRGRPDLETERSRSAEAAVTWSGAADVAVTLFRNHMEDLISPVLVAGETVVGRPVREYRAVGSARIEGISARASVSLRGGFELRAGTSFTRGTDLTDDTPLTAIPPLSGEVAVRRSFATFPLRWIELEGRAAHGQDRVSEKAGEAPTPGYGAFDVRFGLDAGPLRLTGGVENLLDRAYRSHLDPVRLLRPGRNFFVRVSSVF